MKIHKNLLICIFSIFISNYCHANDIAVMGCGYVGLSMAAILSNSGHNVICYDVVKEKVEQLNNHEVPIYEPNLSELLFDAQQVGSLRFTDDFNEVKSSEIFLICVPTPTNNEGKCDCSYIFSALETIISNCSAKDDKIICIKSTISPGTIQAVKDFLSKSGCAEIPLAYNPEFMREGSAIKDIYFKNPIVIASDSPVVSDRMEKIYDPIMHKGLELIKTNFETAEMIKYAWNSFSAMRIAYINELADLCNLIGADIFTIISALGFSEELLPTSLIKPGPGYGGSCFPKDTASFANVLESFGFDQTLVKQAINSNKLHKTRIAEKIVEFMEQNNGKTVAILGLSFKSNTNDIRFSPAITVIEALEKRGIHIRAFDPKAMENMKILFPTIEYSNSLYEAIREADCIVILTEWDEIKEMDLVRVASLCNKKIIFDTRNLLKKKEVLSYGFTYFNMGVQA